MKFALIILLLLKIADAYSGAEYIRCSVKANYEIYKGEGMVERSEGSLVAIPVEFGFFSNDEEFSANFSGYYATLSVRAKSGEEGTKVSLSGKSFRAEVPFLPGRGVEQSFPQEQLSAFNYQSPAGRIVFTKLILRCLPAVSWDHRPVLR